MADILIRGMEMPKGCYFCKLNYNGRGCSITGTMYESDTMVLMDFDEYTQRLEDCPLYELPEHGDLVDRSKLSFVCGGTTPMEMDYVRRYVIDGMPVVIPSNKGETDG